MENSRVTERVPERVTELEESIAHLSRTVEELSDVVARQDRVLDKLGRQVAMLMSREAEREIDAGGADGAGGLMPLDDQKPPHW